MSLAPIVLFVYNRLDHTQKTISALQKNTLAKESELFIYADAAGKQSEAEKVQAVRDFIKTIDDFKSITIIEQKENKGLADSIISGVTEIVNKYGKIIVLEDDLVTSPYFLKFMNDSLNTYEKHSKVASIHGYIYPIDNLPNTFFLKGADCWGWATWKNRWAIFEPRGQKLLAELKSRKLEKEADFNGSYDFTGMLKNQIKGQNDSWAIRWYMSAFLKDMLTLYPGKSYVQNIGFSSEGTHCTTQTNVFDVKLNEQYLLQEINVKEDLESRNKIETFLFSLKISSFKRVKNKIKELYR